MITSNNPNKEVVSDAAVEKPAVRPMSLRNGHPVNVTAMQPTSEFGVWDDLSSKNFFEAFDPTSLQLRADFLRQPSISYTMHPNQRALGRDIAKYLTSGEYGSRLLSLYSDSLFWMSPADASGTPVLLFGMPSTSVLR